MRANKVTEIHQLSLNEIKGLASTAGPCLSILLPLDTAPDKSAQNAIRIKHAIKTAQSLLAQKTVDAEHTRLMLTAIEELAQETNEWSDGHTGLAIFRSPDVFEAFRVPRELPESVSVGNHFNIVPLLPMLNADQAFYILALSQRHIRLLRCTGHSSEEVALPDSIPKTLWEDKQTDQPDHDQSNMSSGGPSTGSMRGVISSTNTDREDRGEYLMHFYKHVDKGIAELLKKEGAPLVIAGVDYETALYRRENSYPHLVEEPVHGAADGLKGGELHKRALEAVQPYFEGPVTQALARYEKQAGSERASTTVKEIVKGAFDGRVSELILAEGAQYMGNFDQATDSVQGHKKPLPGDEDLLNAAAVQTVLHAGQVFVVSPKRVPNGAPAIAVFRW
ncbi:MAG: hypothetical protein M3Y27_08730 [Acidobacteriota bacterium]|nr:hypothetical protein [Acidobacteriota bacterium]